MTTELIENGNFDDDKKYWRFSNRNSEVIGKETIKIDNKYCRIATTESIAQTVPLVTKKKYSLSFNVRGSLAGVAYVMKGNTNDHFWEQAFNESPKNPTDWTKEQLTFTVGDDWKGEDAPVDLVIRFFGVYDDTHSLHLDLDNISLTEV